MVFVNWQRYDCVRVLCCINLSTSGNKTSLRIEAESILAQRIKSNNTTTGNQIKKHIPETENMCLLIWLHLWHWKKSILHFNVTTYYDFFDVVIYILFKKLINKI